MGSRTGSFGLVRGYVVDVAHETTTVTDSRRKPDRALNGVARSPARVPRPAPPGAIGSGRAHRRLIQPACIFGRAGKSPRAWPKIAPVRHIKL